MTDFLIQMADLSEQRAASARRLIHANELDKPVIPIQLSGFDLIAEIKEISPSEGALNQFQRSRVELLADYQQGGAAAISVLTEPSHFGGDIAHLEEVATESGIPVMRKDFLVDPWQILEARAAGASGVLLIAAMLPDSQLDAMLDCAFEHSMFVLLESFDAEDLERTAKLLQTDRNRQRAGQHKLLVGVNTRNLRTLQVDAGRLAGLSPMLPADAVCVAESGLVDSADVENAASLGYRMALVGSALMRSDSPGQLMANMLTAARST